MANRNAHVVPSGNRRAVKPEGVAKPLSTHLTQGAASAAGRAVARQNRLELAFHRPNGQICDKDSFGKDPCPPKDAKH